VQYRTVARRGARPPVDGEASGGSARRSTAGRAADASAAACVDA
jgi:hypothetical protein